jgi:hypothetical protein
MRAGDHNALDLDDWNARIVVAENMTHVDDYIPLIPGVLAMGGPIRNRLLKALSEYVKETVAARKAALRRQRQEDPAAANAKEEEEDIVVCTIVDVTDSTTKEPWWTKELPPYGIEVSVFEKVYLINAGESQVSDLSTKQLLAIARRKTRVRSAGNSSWKRVAMMMTTSILQS